MPGIGGRDRMSSLSPAMPARLRLRAARVSLHRASAAHRARAAARSL